MDASGPDDLVYPLLLSRGQTLINAQVQNELKNALLSLRLGNPLERLGLVAVLRKSLAPLLSVLYLQVLHLLGLHCKLFIWTLHWHILLHPLFLQLVWCLHLPLRKSLHVCLTKLLRVLLHYALVYLVVRLLSIGHLLVNWYSHVWHHISLHLVRISTTVLIHQFISI